LALVEAPGCGTGTATVAGVVVAGVVPGMGAGTCAPAAAQTNNPAILAIPADLANRSFIPCRSLTEIKTNNYEVLLERLPDAEEEIEVP
jgi:hypothetical protein